MAELFKWIQENVPGKLGIICLAVVAVFGILGWLSDHKEIFKPVSKRFTAAKTHKTEYLTDPPPRAKEIFLFRKRTVEYLYQQIVAAEKTGGKNKFFLSGFSGVGKTAIARILFHKLKNQCKQIGWVECQENGSLRGSLLAAIDTDEKENDEKRFAEIKRRLRSVTGETILFLDNVDQPDEMLRKLTGYDITLVVTTRMEQEVAGYTSISIPRLDMRWLDKEQTRVMQNLALMADSRTVPFVVREWIGCEENTLVGLVRTGWLTRTEEGYEVHPIIREIVLLDEIPVEAVKCFLHFVAYETYFQAGENYQVVKFKLNIISSVLDIVLKRTEESLDAAVLLDTAVRLARLGNVTYANECQKNENIDWGKGIDSVIEEFQECAILQSISGRYHKDALDIRLKVLGENHPDTANSYNDLGVVYVRQGKYDEAVELFLKAWKIWQEKLGPEHPHTQKAKNNLRRIFPHIDHGDQDFDTWLSQQ
ncbi:MAG: tetratricopeptide repeat protein [Clostridiales bacterium]|nr:tetratricopeptide repeat protein [Clostridiales bacterium]